MGQANNVDPAFSLIAHPSHHRDPNTQFDKSGTETAGSFLIVLDSETSIRINGSCIGFLLTPPTISIWVALEIHTQPSATWSSCHKKWWGRGSRPRLMVIHSCCSYQPKFWRKYSSESKTILQLHYLKSKWQSQAKHLPFAALRRPTAWIVIVEIF